MKEDSFAILFCTLIAAGILLAARRLAKRKTEGVQYLPWQATTSVLVVLGIQWFFAALYFATLGVHDSDVDRALGNLLYALLILAPIVTVIGAGVLWRLSGGGHSHNQD